MPASRLAREVPPAVGGPFRRRGFGDTRPWGTSEYWPSGLLIDAEEDPALRAVLVGMLWGRLRAAPYDVVGSLSVALSRYASAVQSPARSPSNNPCLNAARSFPRLDEVPDRTCRRATPPCQFRRSGEHQD